MENVEKENGVCSSETANGGRDLWSGEVSDASSPDHLVVMVHGILGSADDWKFGAEQFVHKLHAKLFVHCSERNGAKLTLDGVDVMGERLTEEVLEVIKQNPGLQKISFVTHSVGGLVARYAIGKLFRPLPVEKTNDITGQPREEPFLNGTIGGLEPMNFVTVATPHLGSRGNKQVPFLFGVTAIEKVAGHVIHWIFRRTGRHLFLTDKDEGKSPLLRQMVEDDGDHYLFMSALYSFKRRVTYANVGYDHIVGWRTSSIRRNNELPNWGQSLNEKYPHIVYEEFCKALDIRGDDSAYECSDKIEEELVTCLSRVSWEKVDVSFHKSRLRSAAHSLIQVKDHNMHSEGADVIQHMIDHLIL